MRAPRSKSRSRSWHEPAALFAATTLLCLLLTPSLSAEEQPDAGCTLQAGATRSVVRILDAETVVLDDGEEVRLIGALAPRSPDLRPDAEPWPPEQQATAALRDLVLGRSVELAASGRAKDRYGRRLAHLFLDENGERVWVQGRLLAGGNARAYGLPGSFACARELLAHEAVARDKGLGLWANAAYAIRNASEARAVLRLRNTYQIVRGSVVRVKVTKARTYLDFGPDWRRDFSAGVEAKLLRAEPEWAKTLSGLAGKRVEVRGWIEYRGGPYIGIEDASQIAVVDEEPRATTAPSGPTTSSERPKEKRPEPKLPGAVDL